LVPFSFFFLICIYTFSSLVFVSFPYFFPNAVFIFVYLDNLGNFYDSFWPLLDLNFDAFERFAPLMSPQPPHIIVLPSWKSRMMILALPIPSNRAIESPFCIHRFDSA
jgi:hypothetical protein